MENRRSTIAPRNLTLTEELEKLEQSITLTLQGGMNMQEDLTAEANTGHRNRSQF